MILIRIVLVLTVLTFKFVTFLHCKEEEFSIVKLDCFCLTGPEPAADRPKKARLTQPRTPALESRHRHRPVTAISQSQREEQVVADMKK